MLFYPLRDVVWYVADHSRHQLALRWAGSSVVLSRALFVVLSALIRRAAGKIFVGGVAWETTEATLSAHFSSFGEVRACLGSACSAPPAHVADEAVCDREAPTAATQYRSSESIGVIVAGVPRAAVDPLFVRALQSPLAVAAAGAGKRAKRTVSQCFTARKHRVWAHDVAAATQYCRKNAREHATSAWRASPLVAPTKLRCPLQRPFGRAYALRRRADEAAVLNAAARLLQRTVTFSAALAPTRNSASS